MVFRSKTVVFSRHSHVFYLTILLIVLYIISQSYQIFPRIHFGNSTSKFIVTSGSTLSSKYLIWLDETTRKDCIGYYRHATSARNSSYPFISGDTFRSFSDFVFDETKKDQLSKLEHGDSIFVKADMLSQFFPSVYNSIAKPFVLISHNSDFSAPAPYEKYLNDGKILQWYASNPNRLDQTKVTPIPIGLANRRWPHGNLDRFLNVTRLFRKPWAQRTITLYVNFDASTNRGERGKALARLANLSSNFVYQVKEKITPEKYLEQVGNSKYVLSPPGNGIDCHRTWEALLMGAAPIVLTSGLDPLFRDAPAIVLNNWNELTDELLKSHDFSSFDQRLAPTVTAEYWYQSIRRHKKT